MSHQLAPGGFNSHLLVRLLPTADVSQKLWELEFTIHKVKVSTSPEEKSINFRAFNEMKDKVKLPYGFSREANLIFKEAMTNAFKYSEAKNINFSLKRVDDNNYEIILEDDGIGFCSGSMEKIGGLKNIRERADRINAVLGIWMRLFFNSGV